MPTQLLQVIRSAIPLIASISKQADAFWNKNNSLISSRMTGIGFYPGLRNRTAGRMRKRRSK
jgi:hypothetical protein